MAASPRKEKKRIALFVGKLGGGGAEHMVSRLSFALSERYEVFVLIYNGKISHYPVKGTVINFSRSHQRSTLPLFSILLQFNYVLRKHRIDLVFSFLELPNLINGLCNHSCRRILSIRSYYGKKMLPIGMGSMWYFLMKSALHRADAVHVLSQRQKDVLVSEQAIPPEKIFVLPNLYHTGKIQSSISREQIPAQLLPAFSGPVSVAVGRLTEKKNYRELLAVFRLVLRRLSGATLVILGEGPQEAELKALCGRYQLEDRVFFAGRLLHPYSVMAFSRLYIGLSNNEGFPNALVEAMICGLPVLHSACLTGPAEILGAASADNGLEHVLYAPYGILLPVITPETPPDQVEIRREEIADVWCRMLEDPALRKKYQDLSAQRAQVYDVSRVKGRYFDLIEKVLSDF